MSSEQTVPPAGHHGGSYEKSDLSIKAIVTFAVILTVVVVAALAGMGWMFGFFAAHEERRDVQPSPLAATRPAVPEPRLQVHAVQDLKTFRASEDDRLTHYRWVAKDAGIARIPIDRAMALLVDRGLPSSAKAGGAAASTESRR